MGMTHEGLLREAPCPRTPTLWLEATEMGARVCMERLWHTEGVRNLSPQIFAHRSSLAPIAVDFHISVLRMWSRGRSLYADGDAR